MEISEAVLRTDRPLFAFVYDAIDHGGSWLVGADRPAVLTTVAEWERSGRPYRVIDVARLREWIARTYFNARA